MKKDIFLVVTGLAIGTIVIAGYKIYKTARGIKEVTDIPEDFSIYTGPKDED